MGNDRYLLRTRIADSFRTINLFDYRNWRKSGIIPQGGSLDTYILEHVTASIRVMRLSYQHLYWSCRMRHIQYRIKSAQVIPRYLMQSTSRLPLRYGTIQMALMIDETQEMVRNEGLLKWWQSRSSTRWSIEVWDVTFISTDAIAFVCRWHGFYVLHLVQV